MICTSTRRALFSFVLLCFGFLLIGCGHHAPAGTIAISAANSSLTAGASTQLTAVDNSSNGTATTVTSSVVWTSSNRAIATVSSTGLMTGVSYGVVTVNARAGNGDLGTLTFTIGQPLVSGITLSPIGSSIPLGTTQQFSAFATYANNTSANISSSATWSVAPAAVATISKTGLLTSVATGSYVVSASSGGQTATVAGSVTAAALTALAISPASASVAGGTTQQFTATGTYTNSTTADLTASVVWASSNTSLLSISNTGLATSKGASSVTVQVTATSGAITASVPVVVTPGVMLMSMQLEPTSSSIATGTAEQHTARAFYSDGTQKDVSTLVTWSSQNTSAVANADPAAPRAGPGAAEAKSGLRAGSGGTGPQSAPRDASTVVVSPTGVSSAGAPGTSTISATLGSTTQTSTVIVTSATATALSITSSKTLFPAGSTQKLALSGSFSDMSTQDLSLTANWTSSNPAVATIDATGLATGVAAGSVVFSASFGGLSVSTTGYQVLPSTLVSTIIAARYPADLTGLLQPLQVYGTYSDGSSHDLTSLASFSSANPNIFDVSPNGLAYGTANGSTQISATVGGLTTINSFASFTDPLLSVQVLPPTAKLALGTQFAFTALAQSTNGLTLDVTYPSVWRSADPDILTIGDSGLAKSGKVGTTTVSATVLGVTGTSQTVEVTNATLERLLISNGLTTPTSTTLAAGTGAQFVAVGFFSDGTIQDLTRDVIWDTDDHTIASVDLDGTTFGVTPGQTELTVKLMGQTASTAIVVSNATLVSAALSPGNSELPVGMYKQFSLIGTFSDGTTQDLTLDSIFEAPTPTIVSLVPQGLVLGVGAGVGQITAKRGNFSASTPVRVTNVALTGVSMTPAAVGIRAMGDAFVTATGTFSDGYSQSLVNNGLFTSSNPGIAPVVETGAEGGLVTGMSVGTAQVAVNFRGMAASSTITVQSDTLVSIALAPANPQLNAGSTLQLTATGTYDDGSTGDVTNTVTWTSSAPAVLNVSAAGLATAYSTTSAVNVIVTAQSGTTRQSFTVVVEPAGTTNPVPPAATLTSIAVGPSGTQLPAGGSAQLSAIGTYSDGSTQDLTASSTWTSATPATATVSNTGLVSAQAVGQTTITATSGAIHNSTIVNVGNATVRSLAVTPASASFATGSAQQFTATATLSDNTTFDATSSAAWTSSNTAVATIGSATGRATGVSAGAVQFTASYGGKSGSVNATVTLGHASMTRLVVQPTSSSIAISSAEQHTATAFYADGTQQDVTGQAAWSSSASPVSVTNQGVDTANAAGTATLSAAFGGMTSTSVVLVTPATVTALTIEAASASIPQGSTERLHLFGQFSDGSSQELSLTAGWQSANPAVATIDNSGRVTALSAGSLTLSASFGGLTASTTGFAVSTATLNALTIAAPYPAYTTGLTQALTVIGSFSDGSTHDLTELASFSSSDQTTIAVNAAGTAYGVQPGTATVTATVNGLSAVLQLTSAAGQLQSEQILPASVRVALGTHFAFHASAQTAGGQTVDTTFPGVWTSGDPTLLTIAQDGIAKTGSAGTTTVSSSALGVTGTNVSVTVTNAQLVSLEFIRQGGLVGPATIAAATAESYHVLGFFNDGTVQDVTGDVLLDTSNHAIAAVTSVSSASTGARISGVAPGQVQVTATLLGHSASTTLTVTGANLVSTTLTPGAAELPIGIDRQYDFMGTFSDGSTQDLTYDAVFTTSTPAIVGLEPGGVVHGASAGSGQVSATRGQFSSSTPVQVTQVSLTALAVTPGSASLHVGSLQQLTSVGTFSNGTTQNLDLDVVFTSATPGVAAPVDAFAAPGLLAADATGTAQVTAGFREFTATSNITVLSGTVATIAITPANPSLAIGGTQQMTATATYADGSTADLSSAVTWSSTQGATATVSATGLVTAVAAGTTTISGVYQGAGGPVTGSTTVTVGSGSGPGMGNPTLVSIAVSPSSGSIVKGATEQLSVTGTYSDGSTQDLTASATFMTTDTTVLGVSASGLVSAIGVGTAKITVAAGGQSSMTQVITVTPETLTGIVVTPTSTRIALGTMRQLSATGTYSDGSRQDLTSSATWTSGAASTATVNAAGLVSGVAAGTATIQAAAGGFTSGSTVIVSTATLTSVAITPSGASFPAGTTEQFNLTGSFSDGSTQDLTSAATWSSSTPATATIGASSGLATGVAAGSVQFSAVYQGQTATSATSTVTPATLVSIAVSPAGASFAKGTTQQFKVAGTYSDGTMHDLTSQASFTSSDQTVLSVANGGLASGAGPGMAQLTVSVGGQSVTTPAITVTPATLVSIAVTPASPSLAAGTMQKFMAIGTFSDGTTEDLSSEVVWTSSNPQVLTIDQNGDAGSSQTGSVRVTATFNGTSGSTGTVNVTPATFVSLALSPLSGQIAKGTTQQFTATATYSNGTTQDVSSQATWSSANGAVAGIDSNGLATGNAVGSAQITGTFGGQSISTSSFSVTPATLVSISFEPASPSVAAGTQTQITVIGTYSDGTTQDLTSSSSFASSNPGAATVSSTGILTGVSPGSAVLTITAGGTTSTLSVMTSAATLTGIAITPNPPADFAVGTTQQFTATGTFSDGTQQNVSTSTAWTSSSAAVFTIDRNGLATATGLGTGQISASYQGQSNQTSNFEVTPATVASIAVSPVNPSIAGGTSQQFTATATYTDSSTQDVTGTVSWSSSNPGIASIASTGLAAGRTSGTTTIAAQMNGISGQTTLTVTGGPALVSVSVSPTSSHIAAGTTVQLNATGTYSDGSTQNLNGSTVWTSAATGTATVNASGLVTGAAAGQATIQAQTAGFSNSVTVVVTAATLQSLAVSPSGASFAAGANQQFTLTGTFSDGSTQNLTNSASWASSNPSVASINSSNGLATGVATGTVQFAATYSGQTVLSSSNTVSPATLVSITVTPSGGSFAKGTTEQFTVTGTYSDGSTRDLTSSATYTSSNPAVIAVSSSGLASAAGAGTASVTVTSGGQSFTTAPTTVSPATLVSIAITPNSPSIASGTTQQFTATGTFSDGSTQDVSSQTVWSSSNPSVLTIDATGYATSDSTGSAQVTATLNSVSATTGNVMVTPATLSSLTLSPTSVTIAKGTKRQFTVTAVFSDGSMQNVTGQATWTTSNGAVAGVDANGLATGNAVGSAQVTATYQGFTASTMSFTVTPATLVSIAFSPANPTVAAGTSAQVSVIGTYSDGTTQDLTGAASYASSSPAVATVNAAGLITGVSQGTDTITVSAGGQTSSFTVSVSSAVLTSIAVTPNPPANMPKGTTQQFTAIGSYSDGTTQNLSTLVAWTSSATGTAIIDHNGLATATSLGTVSFTASYQGQTMTTSALSVTPPVMTWLQVTPANGTVSTGSTLQFTATATYSDATTQNLSTQVTWASANTLTASINASGVATGIVPGNVGITATFNGFTSTANLLVSVTMQPATLQSISVTPASSTVIVGATQQYTATGSYSDNSTQNLTSTVTWSASDANATINASGLATGVTAGAASITAASSGVTSNAATLTVNPVPVTLSSIAITPSPAAVGKSSTVQFTAMGTYSDGHMADLTAQVAWSSTASGIATINQSGLATGVAAGNAQIVAALSGRSAMATLTVNPATLASLTISPSSVSLANGTKQQYSAVGTFSDGSTQNLSTSVSWGSSNTALATVNANGLASTTGTGTVSVTATSGVISSNAATLTITSATVTSLQVTPSPVSLASGNMQQLLVTANFTDASSQNVTSSAAYNSSAPAIATVNSAGLLKGSAPGSAVITVSLQGARRR